MKSLHNVYSKNPDENVKTSLHSASKYFTQVVSDDGLGFFIF